MILRKLTPDHPDVPAVKKLYVEAFPERERGASMDQILEYADQLPIDLLGIYPDEMPDTFAGFFLMVNGESFAYLMFFATCPEMRSTGIGRKAINALRSNYGDTPIIFSYESVFEESDNAVQRERRRAFYLRNGFYETGWFTKLNGVEFIIASSQEEFDKDTFIGFMAGLAGGAANAPVPELYRRD